MQKVTLPEGEAAGNEVFHGLYFLTSIVQEDKIIMTFFPNSSEAREVQLQRSLLAYSNWKLEVTNVFMCYGSTMF